MSCRSVVLVTGGSGFLGQHVVNLLQTKAPHVTEIRVLDTVPYRNKMGHKERLEVTSFTGSITDYNHVVEACKGVDSVMHIASIVDISLFPDEQRSYNINVRGTDTVIRACKSTGVKRFIYCSSMSVVMSTKRSIFDGNEDNTEPTVDNENVYSVYGSTKAAAESLVLNANSNTLQTLALRPPGMYGELEYRSRDILEATRTFGYFFRIKNTKPLLYCYVGNIAWAFLCADKTLAREDTNARQVSGNAFFIGDEKPHADMGEILNPMFQAAGAKPFPIGIPLWLIICFMYIVYCVLVPVRLLFTVNISYGLASFKSLTKTYIFCHKKATRMLGYTPLFTAEESLERSTKYYKDVLEGG